MRRTNKIISFVLALVMVLSSACFSLFASAKVDPAGLVADPKTGIITQGYVTENGNANGNNATVLLDYLDSILKNIDVSSMDTIINLAKLLRITIDINSVDGILKTLDSLKSLNDGFITKALIKSVLGYGLVTKNWVKGQTRAKTGDYAILGNLVKFLADNKEFIGAFVANKTKQVNIETVLKKDVYTFAKEAVAKLIYNYEIKDANGNVTGEDKAIKAKYDAAVKMSLDDIIFKCGLGDGVNGLLAKLDNTIRTKYVDVAEPNQVWAFLYKDQGFKFEGSLNGYTYNQKMTLDATITEIINTIYKNNYKFVKALFTEYGERLQNAVIRTKYGAPFAALLKLNTKELSFLDDMSMSGSLKSFNDFAGKFIAGVTTYTGWKTSVNFGANVQNMFMWAVGEALKSDVEDNVYKNYQFGTTFNSYAFALAQLIVEATVKDEQVAKILKQCKTTQEVMTKLLPYLVKDKGQAIVGKNSKTYEQVLGDILGYYLNNYAILYTDAANKTRYTVSSGKTYLDVLNYAANYYLCDLSFSTLLGVKLSKTESFLSKLDKLQAVIFTGTQTLQYSKASALIPGVINAIVNLDLSKLVEVGFEKSFTDINKTVSASNLVYAMLNNLLKGVLSVKVFEGNFVSLDKMISNDSLEKAVGNILTGLNTRKGAILPVALYLFTALSDQCKFVVSVSGTVQATGKANDGNVKIINAYNKKALRKGTDFTVTAKGVKPGNATVTVTGKGNYVGSVTKSFKIVCTKHKSASKVTKNPSYTANGTRLYYCAFCGKTIKTETIPALKPAKVTGLKASSIKTTSLKLTWAKAAGAVKYEVYQSTDGKKWTKIATTTANSVTVKKLSAAKNYQFKVRAISKLNKVGDFSAVLKTGTQTKAVSGVKLKSSKSKQVNVTWSKTSGAKKYIVQYTTDKKFKKSVKSVTVTKNKATIKKLKGGKKVYVRVIAVNAYGINSAASKVSNVKVKK